MNELDAKLEDFTETIEFTDITYRVEWLAPAYENSDILRRHTKDFVVEDGNDIHTVLIADQLYRDLVEAGYPVQLTKWTDEYKWAMGVRIRTTVNKLMEESK